MAAEVPAAPAAPVDPGGVGTVVAVLGGVDADPLGEPLGVGCVESLVAGVGVVAVDGAVGVEPGVVVCSSVDVGPLVLTALFGGEKRSDPACRTGPPSRKPMLMATAKTPTVAPASMAGFR